MLVSTGFFPAKTATVVPAVKGLPQANAPTFLKGYPVVLTAGLVDECGVNPALIAGVALADNSTNPGFAEANNPTVITGRSLQASIAVANDATEFSGFLVNNSAVIIAPVAADLGAQYGITKFAGNWRVDKAKNAGNARLIITSIDTFNNFVLFKFLSANQQLDS